MVSVPESTVWERQSWYCWKTALSLVRGVLGDNPGVLKKPRIIYVFGMSVTLDSYTLHLLQGAENVWLHLIPFS
jgi:hypothetical protein